MATAPLDTGFTPRELAASERAAAMLWIVSGALLGLIVLWSTGPHGLA
jgi:hypothetical protein